MAATIKDVAKHAGVSTSTVSMVLGGNGQYRISQATRDRVVAAAKSLRYRPNRVAASLVTKRSRTLGLLVPDIANPFFAEIASAVEERCAQSDYSVILCNTNDLPQQDVRYLNLLLERNVDGVLFVMAVNDRSNRADECLQLLREAQVPAVLIDRHLEGAVNVVSDNQQGGYLACRHLLELGHTKIGCMTGPMGSQSSQNRLSGYVRALREYGLAFDPRLVVEGDYHTDSGYTRCGRLLEENARAVFACNDMMALGVYRRLREIGARVPDDISVVGYDNLSFTGFLDVPLTTVSQPAREMGATATCKLLAMLQGGEEPGAVFVPRLIQRDSTAPPLGAQ